MFKPQSARHGEQRDHHYEDEKGIRVRVSDSAMAQSACERFCEGCQAWFRCEGVMGNLRFMAAHDSHKDEMKTLKYEVTLRAVPSQGGGSHRVEVEAHSADAAIVSAMLKLEDEKGVDSCSLVSCVKVTS